MPSCCSPLVAVWRGTDKCSQPCRASQLTVASCLNPELSLASRGSGDRQPALSLVGPAHVTGFLPLIGRFRRELAVNHPATVRHVDGHFPFPACSTEGGRARPTSYFSNWFHTKQHFALLLLLYSLVSSSTSRQFFQTMFLLILHEEGEIDLNAWKS